MRKNKDLFSIFPADAGVNLDSGASGEVYGDIPRGCGGEPSVVSSYHLTFRYSPRMRG